MSLVELLLVSLYFGLFLIISCGLGSWLISFYQKILDKKKKNNIDYIGVSILLGMGVIANLGLLLARFGWFNKKNLLIILSFITVISIKKSFFLIKNSLANLIKIKLKDNLISVGAILAVGLILISLYLTSMQPPHATDELHYHFPQARKLAESGRVGWSFDEHFFFGNIPKLMEIIFAEGLVIQGYQLAHALNFLVMFGFLILVFEVIRKTVNLKAGSLVVLLLLLFEDFVWNATVGFVDSATAAYEIGGLLIFLSWLLKKERVKSELSIAGSLLGLAMAIKYSPTPTILLVLLLLFIFRKKETISDLVCLSVPALLLGGYWYLKNWILFSNPFYPIYFGHKGVDETVYLSQMNNIQQWGPKTFNFFVEKIEGRYKNNLEFTTYWSFWLSPIALFLKQTPRLIKFLSVYLILYTLYWFFLGSHQVRFLLPALITAIIIFGWLMAKINEKLLLGGLVLLSFYGLLFRTYPARNIWQNYWYFKLHEVGRQYAFNNISEREFLTREFGCQYDVVDFINNKNLDGLIIDQHGDWITLSVDYFTQKNIFINKGDNYQYRVSKNNDPIVDFSELIFESGECKLYKIINN